MFEAKRGESAVVGLASAVAAAAAELMSPWSIHSRISFTCSGVRGSPPMGMRGASVRPRIRFTSRLSALLPATMAGPELPPRTSTASEPSCNLPMAASPKWHLAQACWNMGRMSFSKASFWALPCAALSRLTERRTQLEADMGILVECIENCLGTDERGSTRISEARAHVERGQQEGWFFVQF